MFLTPVPLCPLDFSYTEFCSPPTPQINLFFLHVHSFCSALNHFFCGPSRILYLLFISLCLICSTSPPLRFKFFVVLYSVKNRPATRWTSHGCRCHCIPLVIFFQHSVLLPLPSKELRCTSPNTSLLIMTEHPSRQAFLLLPLPTSISTRWIWPLGYMLVWCSQLA